MFAASTALCAQEAIQPAQHLPGAALRLEGLRLRSFAFAIPCTSPHSHVSAFGACWRLVWRLALHICTFGGKSCGMANALCWRDISAWRCPSVWGVLECHRTFYNSWHPVLLRGGCESAIASSESLTGRMSFDRSFRIACTASMSRHLQEEKAKCRASGRRQRNPCWR